MVRFAALSTGLTVGRAASFLCAVLTVTVLAATFVAFLASKTWSRDLDAGRRRRPDVCDGADVDCRSTSTSAVATPVIVRRRRDVASVALHASTASVNVNFFC